MANANVGIFYMSPSQAASADGTTFTMTELASGTTDASGQFSATLDTSSIAPSDLADIGDGTSDAFNAVIEALDPSGNFTANWVIITEGSGYSGTASVNDPAPAGSPAAAPAPPLSGKSVVLAHGYRYTPVTPLNSGYGIQVVLNYTTSSETTRQTEVQEGVVAASGGVSVGAYQIEDQSRMITSPDSQSGSYHNWVWADYEYKEYRTCAQNCGGSPPGAWKPYEFTGQAITDNNPNKDKNGQVIGIQGYTQPNFTPGSSNQNWFRLTPSNSGWSRSSGTRESNDVNGSFIFPFASNLGIDSLTTYGSITSVQYNWISSGSCGTGFTRVIWGHDSTPADTGRVQASCIPDSQL